MSIRGLLPDPPTTPGDTDSARDYHQRIMALLDADDAEREARPRAPRDRPRQFPRLTKSQRVYLQRLEAKWLRRAIGADHRWNLYGPDRHGRLPIRSDPAPAPAPDPELSAWIRSDHAGATKL